MNWFLVYFHCPYLANSQDLPMLCKGQKRSKVVFFSLVQRKIWATCKRKSEIGGRSASKDSMFGKLKRLYCSSRPYWFYPIQHDCLKKCTSDRMFNVVRGGWETKKGKVHFRVSALKIIFSIFNCSQFHVEDVQLHVHLHNV